MIHKEIREALPNWRHRNADARIGRRVLHPMRKFFTRNRIAAALQTTHADDFIVELMEPRLLLSADALGIDDPNIAKRLKIKYVV